MDHQGENLGAMSLGAFGLNLAVEEAEDRQVSGGMEKGIGSG